MIPPKLPIRISGEAGKRLGPQRISLELVGGTDATLILRSLDVDVAQWNQRDGPTVPEDDELVSLWDADDRRIFMGRAQSRFVWGKGGSYYQVSIMGPYEFLKKAELLAPNTDPSGATAIRALKTFPRGDLRASVLELLTMAVDQGAEFRIGEVSPSFAVPQMTFKGNSFHDALTDMNRWPSDVMTRVRYDVDSLPLLDVLRRADAVTQVIQLQSDTNLCTEILMEAQPDLVPSSVSVQYVTRDPVTYKPIYSTETAGIPAGPAYKRQNVTVSGPENDSFLPGETYESVQLQTNDPRSWSFMEANDPVVTQAIATYGALPSPLVVEIVNPYTFYTADPGAGGSTITYYTNLLKYYDQDGNVLAGSWYRISNGAILPDWVSDYGITVVQGSMRGWFGGLLHRNAFSTGTQLRDYSETLYQLQQQGKFIYLQIYDGPPYVNANRAGYGWYDANVPMTLINVPYAVLTEIWKQQDYEFLQPPPGLADNLYTAQQWLPYEGRALFAPKAQNVAGPGEVVSVTGAVPPAWATANALVKQVEWDLRNGSSRVDIGFPIRTDATALLDKFRRSASDNIEQTG